MSASYAIKKLAKYHNIDLTPVLETIKIESFDENNFSKEDVFYANPNKDLEKYLEEIFKKNKNKFEDRTYTQYVSDLMCGILAEEIIATIYNRKKNGWEIRKNPKSSDFDKTIKRYRDKKGQNVNSEPDWDLYHKGKFDSHIELMVDYTSLIPRFDYLTFRGLEGVKGQNNTPSPYKNKFHFLNKNSIPILVLILMPDQRWNMSFVKPSQLNKIGDSTRKDYGKGAVKIGGFRKNMKSCKFLNEKS